MGYDYNPYTLPTVDFVGGETETLVFNVYSHTGHKAMTLTGDDCKFSIVSFGNKMGEPICTKEMEIHVGSDGVTDNVLSVTLVPSDTRDLYGKYIYQLTIHDKNGAIEIPKQGILYITNNIDKALI